MKVNEWVKEPIYTLALQNGTDEQPVNQWEKSKNTGEEVKKGLGIILISNINQTNKKYFWSEVKGSTKLLQFIPVFTVWVFCWVEVEVSCASTVVVVQ